MVQGGTERPELFIDNGELHVVNRFTYLRSLVINTLLLGHEVNTRIGKATTMNK
jgi:hypothetical protein